MMGFDGREVAVKMPYVVDELCNGCGICENVCPVDGKSAIEVFAVNDRTPLEENPSLEPVGESDPYGYPQ